MRIRRQPQIQSTTQGVRADNSSNGNLSSPAVAELETTSVPQHDMENMHASIGDLSMIYSASKFRPSVNWLDRLRAAKGFPVDHNFGAEEVLLSRACSPEETQCCCLGQDGSACLKQESLVGHNAAGLASNNTDIRVLETSSCQTLVSDIKKAKVAPKSLSCSNDVAEVHSQTLGEHPSPALQQEDTMRNNGVAQVDASCCRSSLGPSSSSAIATGSNTNGHNAFSTGKRSRSKVIQNSSCQDSNIESAISQLYFNMFADLFCMESCGTNALLQEDAKRRQRKQEKPKVCSTLADLDTPCTLHTSPQLQTCEFDTHLAHAVDSGNPTSQSEVGAVLKVDIPSSSPKVLAMETALIQKKKTPKKVFTAESKKKNDKELDGIPMNDLFIIDTSIPGWRTEKVIYRNGNGWRIRSRGAGLPAKGATTASLVKETKKQVNVPLSTASRIEPSKAQRPRESETCIEKNHKADANSIQFSNGNEHVAPLWNIAPHTHMRSSRKRRKTTQAAEEPFDKIAEAVHPNVEPVKKSMAFASDHPANQPKEGLVYSIYQVFMQAGKLGLTAREAVSRILEQGLPGLHEGGVVPRAEVLKIVSNSPYFMPLEESKYILCSALVGDEDLKADHKQDTKKDTQNGDHMDIDNGYNSNENAKAAKPHGMSQYWAACAAIRRARTGTTRRKPSLGSYPLNSTIHETHEEIAYLAHKKRLKSVKQDVTGLGNPCNRSDGKGWHCPLRAKVGYLLCDHHLDRLRTRVKSHIKSKMLSISKGSKEERKRILNGSWVVKKVVERSRTGRPSHVPLGVDAQDNFPVADAAANPEVSGAKYSHI